MVASIADMARKLIKSNNETINTIDDVEYLRNPNEVPMDEIEAKVNEELANKFFIPLPYRITNNKLVKVSVELIKDEDGQIVEVEKETMVSRLAPKIVKEFSDVERNSVHYTITWIDRGREKREVVPAITIATKRELMTLADKGFPCHDLNCKSLIDYFNKYLTVNELEQAQMVERLGHIKGLFIHPLASNGIEIIPNDFGEKQLLEAFTIKGTVEGWTTEVFNCVKDYPKVLFLILSSFASVLLHDLKISPFIVDLSGSTSQGKTTALQVARSVWGSEGLLNEWNATTVSIERKAGFLNSFPLYMDDTRKADERTLQPITYQFSGGRSKGRGSLKGSQRELTWESILISTGEVSLTEYISKAGGAAARVIPLVDDPFPGVDYEYFSNLYEAIDNNYGAVGLEFVKHWQVRKDSLLPEFHKFKEHYMEKTKGNEVLTRISMYYAAVHFVGSVLRKIFSLPIDLKQLDLLFEEISAENQATDKPKQLLEEILLLLDSSRGDICYDNESNNMKAIYKFGTICVMPAFLKEYLGAEEKLIRREWMKRGFTQSYEQKGKLVDYTAIKLKRKTFRAVVINKSFIDTLGFNFNESDF